ncbi:hypothetical protein [Pseudoduganella namucuonensis]|uniref:hypothetical protein n=1 Tax=Pseudoduganella namucuonensis TaxID=1035707 RepID=UPI001160802E|nr:hypothetical protein [Pseudoduganella namucuonensis]
MVKFPFDNPTQMTWFEKWVAMTCAAAVALGGYHAVSWSAMGRQDWAAWVQAIGSILAIIAAFLVSERQFKMSRRADQARLNDETLRQLGIACIQRLQAARSWRRRGVRYSDDAAEMPRL